MVRGVSLTSGTTAGGTPVTITGTGFLAGATVSLGGDCRDGRDGGAQHVDHGDSPGACGRCGERGSDQHGQPKRHSAQRIHLHFFGRRRHDHVRAGEVWNGEDWRIAGCRLCVGRTAGNMNVVAVMWGDTTSTVSSVTDSQNNTYVLAVGPTTASGLSSALYYAANIIGGSNTVTVTFNTTAAAQCKRDGVQRTEYQQSVGRDLGGDWGGDDSEQRFGDHDLGQRADCRSGQSGDHLTAAGVGLPAG